MSAGTKKWVNRGGLIAIAIGTAAFALTGGGMETAGEIVTIVGGLTGTVLVLIREIMG